MGGILKAVVSFFKSPVGNAVLAVAGNRLKDWVKGRSAETKANAILAAVGKWEKILLGLRGKLAALRGIQLGNPSSDSVRDAIRDLEDQIAWTEAKISEVLKDLDKKEDAQ